MRTALIRPPRLLQHVLTWLGFAVYEQSVMVITDLNAFELVPVVGAYLLNAVLFYGHSLLVLPWLYRPGRYLSCVLASLGLLAVYALVRTELQLHLLPALELAQPSPLPYERFWLLAGYRGTFFLGVSTGYWFARQALALEKQKRRHDQQLQATEKTLLEANLSFLKSQINPHFLFNCLNFIYAQVYPHSESAARGIMLLADTMRYALHDDHQGKVLLQHEVEHLHNYIALQQLRYHDQLQVQFEVVGSGQFLLILPLVLITFVENCFKHGDLTDPADPLRLQLVTENHLTFYARNKKRHGLKETRSGIGLRNTQQRLALLYPAQHTLTVTDEPDYYTCRLTLEL
jgi:hypothetical protein